MGQILKRALAIDDNILEIQWVRGDAANAENSFVRINQQAANITPQELELIQSCKKPNAIAARAIIQRGTGHQYWSSFPDKNQRRIKDIASEIHTLVLNQRFAIP